MVRIEFEDWDKDDGINHSPKNKGCVLIGLGVFQLDYVLKKLLII